MPINTYTDCIDCGYSFDTDDQGSTAACGCCWRCDDCGSVYSGDSDDGDDYDDDGRNFGTGRIYSYDYRPSSFRPKGDYPSAPLMGVELEVGGNGRDISSMVANHDPSENHLYCKYDGSIDGVEIVTHPMTLDWARGYDFEGLLRNLRSVGATAGDGYGLHVHVSRNAFRRAGKHSSSHQMSWLMFMYRNSAELELLARRRASRWASFRKPAKGELKEKAIQHQGTHHDRYVAVNCQNDKTYELRFFQSTVDATEFNAAMEFADASVEYTRGLDTSKVLRSNALAWSRFEDYVMSNEQRYPSLMAELERIESLPRLLPSGTVVTFTPAVAIDANRNTWPSGNVETGLDAVEHVDTGTILYSDDYGDHFRYSVDAGPVAGVITRYSGYSGRRLHSVAAVTTTTTDAQSV